MTWSATLLDSPYRGALGPNFLHGYASASYQIEGGYEQDGRGPSVWDVALKDMDNGEEACDSYNRWREDVALLVKYGVNSYRFSLSWSRIIPLGGKDDPVNPKGIKYYSDLIDALLENGITPLVTIYHWDLPLELEKRYGGFVASGEAQERLLEDYEHYASVCFDAFGDRVKHWITHNEPQVFSMLVGGFLSKDTFDMNTDRWVLARNMILTHARAVDLYRRKYQSTQNGTIGITLNIEWCEPYDDSPEAIKAAQESLDIHAGLFADPIYLGRINPTIKALAGDAYPDFTPEEWKIIRGSSDFFGLNHYSTRWCTGKPMGDDPTRIKTFFGGTDQVTEREDGTPIGFRGHNGHPYTVPWGFHKLLHYVNDAWVKSAGEFRGGPMSIVVTENGFAGQDEAEQSLEVIVDDARRQEYFESYLLKLVQATREGVPISGYMGWSLLDNLEWSAGYGPCFGVTHVDRKNGFVRTPKDSAFYLKEVFAHLTATKGAQ